MKELHSEIEIDASAASVWRILTDFSSYPQWNPFIRRISGELATGERLEVRLEPPETRGITLRPAVLNAEPNHQLRWLGHCSCQACLMASTPYPSSRWKRTAFVSSREKRSRACSSPCSLAVWITTRGVGSRR